MIFVFLDEIIFKCLQAYNCSKNKQADITKTLKCRWIKFDKKI